MIRKVKIDMIWTESDYNDVINSKKKREQTWLNYGLNLGPSEGLTECKTDVIATILFNFIFVK